MTRLSFFNGHIITPSGTISQMSFCVDNGRITSVERDQKTLDPEAIDLEGGYLVPGFIDTQLNGGNGVLFNQTPTLQAIDTIGKAHLKHGTTGFLPTLISDELSVIKTAILAVDQAIEDGVPGVLGIHIEGPFISKERKGIHDSSLFRTLDTEAKSLLKSARLGKTLVTLAPETCTIEDIAQLKRAGVIISAGHSNATYEATVDALRAGVSGFTHLFNAMSPMQSRSPGVVGAALENQDAYCGVIMDGKHVHPSVLRIALKTRPIDRFMLVTDAMPTVGSSVKSFKINGRDISVVDGICVDENGVLAGSDLNMAAAFAYCVQQLNMSVEQASIMASTAPATFLGLNHSYGAINKGYFADLVRLDKNLSLINTWSRGVINP